MVIPPDFHLLIPKVYNINKIAVSLSLEFSEGSLDTCIVSIAFGVFFVFCYKALFVFNFLDNK